MKRVAYDGKNKNQNSFPPAALTSSHLFKSNLDLFNEIRIFRELPPSDYKKIKRVPAKESSFLLSNDTL